MGIIFPHFLLTTSKIRKAKMKQSKGLNLASEDGLPEPQSLAAPNTRKQNAPILKQIGVRDKHRIKHFQSDDAALESAWQRNTW